MLKTIKEMLKEKAPLIADSFQNPTEDSKFFSLEKIIEADLPENFKSLYLSSNGFSPDKYANLFYGLTFSPIEKIISNQEDLTREKNHQPLRYADNGIRNDYTFGLKRVPIGDDSGTSLLCIDLDPAERGVYGQVILVDYDMGVALKLNNSIAELINQFENDLKNNRYSLQEDALEDGVHWLKPDREIDPVNWFNSPTWQYVNNALKNS